MRTQPTVRSAPSALPAEATLSLDAEWDELADRAKATPFARAGWFAAWTKAFGPEIEPAIVRHEGLRALAPFVSTPAGLRAPVNQETPHFALLASDEASRTRLARELLSRRHAQVEMLRLSRQDVDALESAAGMSGHRTTVEVMQRSPFIEIEGSWEDYEKTISTKFRKDLRRRERRLAEEGKVAIEVMDGSEDLDELLGEGLAVEALSWKGEQGTAIKADPATETFYREVAIWAAARGWLRLWFLRLDGKAIAFCFDIDDGHAYYGLKVAHDPAFAKTSPGMILQDQTVKYAFDQQLSSFEFLGNDEAYKLKWTKTCHELYAWRGYDRGPRGTTAWLARTVVRPAVNKLRS